VLWAGFGHDDASLVDGGGNDPAPVRTSAWERLRLYGPIWWMRMTADPDAGRQHDQDIAAIRAEASTTAQDLAVCPDVADKPQARTGPTAPWPSSSPWPFRTADLRSSPTLPASSGRMRRRRRMRSWGAMPDFLRRKQELSAALIKQQPWRKNTPEKLEALVLARIR